MEWVELFVQVINPLTPVPPITARANNSYFPVPPVTARVKAHGTIAFPTLPEDFLVLLLFLRTNKPIRMDFLSII